MKQSNDRNGHADRSKTRQDLPLVLLPMHDNVIRFGPSRNYRSFSGAKKDGADWYVGVQSFYQPKSGFHQEADDSDTKIPEWQNDSKRSGASRVKVIISALAGGIQTPGQNISLNFLIPLVCHKFFKPCRKLHQFAGRQLRNCNFQFLNGVHNFAPISFVG